MNAINNNNANTNINNNNIYNTYSNNNNNIFLSSCDVHSENE